MMRVAPHRSVLVEGDVPLEVLGRYPHDVAVPLAKVAQEDERIPDLPQRLSVLRPSLHLADDVFIAVACIQGLPEGTVG